jgi:hypothetical protein
MTVPCEVPNDNGFQANTGARAAVAVELETTTGGNAASAAAVGVD